MSFKKRATKSIALAIVGVSLASPILNTVSAMENGFESEVVTIENEKYIIERTVSEDSVLVNTKSLNGDIIHTVLSDSTGLKLDNRPILESGVAEIDEPNSEKEDRAIKWGPWQTSTQTIKINGLTVVAVSTLLMAKFPHLAVAFASNMAMFLAGKYSSVKVVMKTRLGSESRYSYYERLTYFYGNGTTLVGDPFREYRKTADRSAEEINEIFESEEKVL